jgi:uncharacterized protein with HEPN domain
MALTCRGHDRGGPKGATLRGRLDFERFVADERTTDAVIRQLTIIGEAANHVPAEVAGMAPLIDWALIRGFRNVVVHVYFGTDLRIVWEAVQTDLPYLEIQLTELLKILPADESSD